MRGLLATLLVATVAGAVAALPPNEEHDRLAAQRQAIEGRFAAEQADCAGRFAVTSCVEAARLKRRDALVALQRAQAALALRERQAAAERRRAAIQSRVGGEPTQPAVAAAAAPASAARPARAVTTPKPGLGDSAPVPPAAGDDRRAREHRARTAYDRRQRDAEAHRQEVEQLSARRAARGQKPAAPLPAPASAVSR